MASVFDFIKDIHNVSVPRAESIISVLLLVVEHNDALKSVDFSTDALAHDHVADFSLGTLLADADELGQFRQTNSGVVLFNYTHVVLDQLLH